MLKRGISQSVNLKNETNWRMDREERKKLILRDKEKRKCKRILRENRSSL